MFDDFSLRWLTFKVYHNIVLKFNSNSSVKKWGCLTKVIMYLQFAIDEPCNTYNQKEYARLLIKLLSN